MTGMIRKMGLKSAFNGLAADLRSKAAARLIPLGLINRLEMAAKGFAHGLVPGVARASWIKLSLVLFTAGLWCLALRGATHTNTYGFEPPPPRPGSIQWDLDQSAARKRQESYRKRMRIPPDALGANVPRSAAASLVNGPRIVAAPTSSPIASSRNVFQMFFSVAAFVLTGVLIVQKFAPQVLIDINQSLNPWAPAPAVRTGLSAKVRAEEEAFASFMNAFRVGPVVITPC